MSAYTDALLQEANSLYKDLNTNPYEFFEGWTRFGLALNPLTKVPYQGINQIMLLKVIKERKDPRFLTFKQANDQHLKIKKGAKGFKIWRLVDKKLDRLSKLDKIVEENEEQQSIKVMVPHTVFNATDIEGIGPWVKPTIDMELPEYVNSMVGQYIRDGKGPQIKVGGDRAFYRVSEHTIYMPPIEAFKSLYDYMSTLIHELAHSTGAKDIFDREGITGTRTREIYSKEECIADIASMRLCSRLGLEPSEQHMESHKAYWQGYLKHTENTPLMFYQVLKQAVVIEEFLYQFTLNFEAGHDVLPIKTASNVNPRLTI